MRTGAEQPAAAPAPPVLAMPLVLREGSRALAAFALYVVLYPAWQMIGAHEAYQAVVLALASAFVRATQHYPVYSTLTNLKVTNLDFLLIFVLGCFLVSTRMPWRTRLRRYGMLTLIIVVLHVAGVVLEVKDDAARDLLAKENLVLLLPWEYRVVDGFKYLLIDFGLTIGPFAVLLLGFAWNAGIGLSSGRAAPAGEKQPATGARPARAARADRGGRAGTGIARRAAGHPGFWSRRSGRATIAVALGLTGGMLVWRLEREANPLHVQTHVKLGHLFLRSDQPAKAEDQYRIALDHGSTDGEAFYNLAGIASGNGHTGEAIRILRRGLDVVDEGKWRRALQQESARLTSPPPAIAGGQGDVAPR